MTAADEGLVYELHFDAPIGDPAKNKGQAQHYIGHTEDLDRRLAEHRGGHTAAIMRAVNAAGIGWRLVRTWPGTRDTERQIKLLRSGRRLCPECTEHPLTGAGAVARAAALRAHREAQAARRERLEAQGAGLSRERAAARAAAEADPDGDGQRMARQWLASQDEGGRSADQIEAAHEYLTAPWAEMAHRTEAETDRYRGYTDQVRAALAEFRDYETETGPAGPANEMEAEMQEYDTDGNPSAEGDADAAQYEHEPETWLARDGDGQVLEVDADGHPGREASPDDGRPVAEAMDAEPGGSGQYQPSPYDLGASNDPDLTWEQVADRMGSDFATERRQELEAAGRLVAAHQRLERHRGLFASPSAAERAEPEAEAG